MMSHAYINASRGGILWHKDSCCHFKQVATISTTEWASASCLWYPICWLFLFSNFSGLFSSYCLFSFSPPPPQLFSKHQLTLLHSELFCYNIKLHSILIPSHIAMKYSPVWPCPYPCSKEPHRIFTPSLTQRSSKVYKWTDRLTDPI